MLQEHMRTLTTLWNPWYSDGQIPLVCFPCISSAAFTMLVTQGCTGGEVSLIEEPPKESDRDVDKHKSKAQAVDTTVERSARWSA